MKLSELMVESLFDKFETDDIILSLKTLITLINLTKNNYGIKNIPPSKIDKLHSSRKEVITILDKIKNNRRHWTGTDNSKLEILAIQVLKKYDDFFEEYKNI